MGVERSCKNPDKDGRKQHRLSRQIQEVELTEHHVILEGGEKRGASRRQAGNCEVGGTIPEAAKRRADIQFRMHWV